MFCPDKVARAANARRKKENAMNYSTDFPTIKDRVSPQEWQARLGLAACYRLVESTT